MSAEDNRDIMALVVPALEPPFFRTCKWGLEELQEAVGGLIESLPSPYRNTVVYGNDEAKFSGDNGGPMPYNVRATMALQRLLLPGDFIAGNVVLLGVGRDGYDDDIDPDEVGSMIEGSYVIVTPEGALIDV